MIYGKDIVQYPLLTAIYICLLFYGNNIAARNQIKLTSQDSPIQCIAFSPYVGNLSPNYGAHPSKALINELLDTIIKKTSFRCIMTYGVLNGRLLNTAYFSTWRLVFNNLHSQVVTHDNTKTIRNHLVGFHCTEL